VAAEIADDIGCDLAQHEAPARIAAFDGVVAVPGEDRLRLEAGGTACNAVM
jgi:hypothetical protein